VADAPGFSCAATLEGVRQLAGLLQASMQAADVPDAARIDLELAVVEAANNIVLHGIGDQAGMNIELSVRQVPGGVEVVLEDGGSPIPSHLLDVVTKAGLEAESGRGLELITACTDRVDYASSAGRNRLVLFKALAGGTAT